MVWIFVVIESRVICFPLFQDQPSSQMRYILRNQHGPGGDSDTTRLLRGRLGDGAAVVEVFLVDAENGEPWVEVL